eukprot:SAG11_NODE_2084_length_3847_cov_2.877801_5_plen_42_part_00
MPQLQCTAAVSECTLHVKSGRQYQYSALAGHDYTQLQYLVT